MRHQDRVKPTPDLRLLTAARKAKATWTTSDLRLTILLCCFRVGGSFVSLIVPLVMV